MCTGDKRRLSTLKGEKVSALEAERAALKDERDEWKNLADAQAHNVLQHDRKVK